MNKFAFILIQFFFVVNFFAQETGGLSFLKIGFDARNVALGDVGVVAANDVSASAYNPANLTNNNFTQVSFTHNSWINDVTSELLAAKFNLFGINLGLNINSASIKNIEVRTNPGEAISTFNANYLSAELSTGFFVADNISFGFGAKYIYEQLFSDDANGYGFDFGVSYSKIIDNLNLSISLQNIGSMNHLKEIPTKLPSSLSFGASYSLPTISENIEFVGFVATRKYFNEDVTHFNFAAEGNYKKIIYLRFGYQSGYDARSYSVGVGFVWRNFVIDYAFAPFGFDLGYSNVIGVKFGF